MGNLLTKAMGNVLTMMVGNVLTEGMGKVLDIYSRSILANVMCPNLIQVLSP